jgi:hypothetical protein
VRPRCLEGQHVPGELGMNHRDRSRTFRSEVGKGLTPRGRRAAGSVPARGRGDVRRTGCEPWRVRSIGCLGRKKLLWSEKKSAMPGVIPDPSLDWPRVEGPTGHHRGGPCPGRRWSRNAGARPVQRRPDIPAVCRSRSVRDVLVSESPPASCRRDIESGGDRVHRGEPLLLGVGKEYQISYRDWPSCPAVFPRAIPKAGPNPIKGHPLRVEN